MENREISAPGADFVDGLILGDDLENAPSWRDDDEEDDRGCRCETDNQITCATKPPPDDEDDD